jgi:hypothetical protein
LPFHLLLVLPMKFMSSQIELKVQWRGCFVMACFTLALSFIRHIMGPQVIRT